MAGPGQLSQLSPPQQSKARQRLLKLLSGGWEIANFTTAVAGLFGSSLAAKASIWMLPVTAFLMGTAIRDEWDREHGTSNAAKEWRRRSAAIILNAAVDDAIERHLTKYPNSRLKSSESAIGIRLPQNLKSTLAAWNHLYKNWHRTLNWEISEQWALHWQDMDDADSNIGRDWKRFVMRRFVTISEGFGILLVQAEHSIGGRYQ